MPLTLVPNAPDLLLDKIGELTAILSKYKIQNPSGDAIEFYEKLLGTMRIAWAYMVDTKWIHDRNAQLESHNRWLIDYHKVLESRLNEYETVLKLKSENRLSEIDEICSKMVANAFSIRQQPPNNPQH